MTQYLPSNLLALFAPREPIPYLPPVNKLPYQKKTAGYSGIAAYIQHFEDPANTPPARKMETREERLEQKRKFKAESVAYRLEKDIALWNPKLNPNATSDPYKTLFVARMNYDTSESKLRREFEVYGNIRKLVRVHEKDTNKPRGYAFIEYEKERDMRTAYKHADARKIDGRRVVVDVERGRTVQGWLPRRLGGGLGGTRRGGPEVNVKHSGREDPQLDRHYRERERERPERPERRSRSRSRERRRKSRSRSRDRHRSDRHKRERSRERDRTRDHNVSMDKNDGVDGAAEIGPEGEPAKKERRRSRSRDRERRRRRSRDRKRRDDKDRESRRGDRDRGGDRDDRKKAAAFANEIPMTEPSQDNFNDQGYDGDYNNFNNNSMEENNFEGY